MLIHGELFMLHAAVHAVMTVTVHAAKLRFKHEHMLQIACKRMIGDRHTHICVLLIHYIVSQLWLPAHLDGAPSGVYTMEAYVRTTGGLVKCKEPNLTTMLTG